MRLLGSVVDATGTTINTEGGNGANAGGDGRYVFGYSVSLGSGTKQFTQFQPHSGVEVRGTEIYSSNVFLEGTGSPNIPGLVDISGSEAGAEAFGLLPLSVEEVFTDQFTDQFVAGSAPENVALAAVRLDGGWGYNYPGYDMVLVANLSPVGWDNPHLGVGSRAAVQMMTGGWQYDTRFGGSGDDPVLEELAAGRVYVTLIPEAETSLTVGANVVGGGYQEVSFSIANDDIVYLTNSLVVPFTATENDGEGLTFTADASEASVAVEVDGSDLIITPEPGYEGYFTVELTANDRSEDGVHDVGRSGTQSFGVTVRDAVIQGTRFDDVDGDESLTTPPDTLIEGAAVHVDLNDNSVVDAGEVFLSNQDGHFAVTNLPAQPPAFTVTPLGSTAGDDPTIPDQVASVGEIVSVGDIGSKNWVAAGVPLTGFEGSTLTFVGNVTRPTNAQTLAYRWTVKDLDENDLTPAGGDNWIAVPTGTDTLSPSLNFLPLDAGTYVAKLEIQGTRSDSSVFSYFDTTTVTAGTAVPSIDLGSDFTIAEGIVKTWPGMLDNLSSDAWLVEIDGDGDGVFERSFTTSETQLDLTYAWLTPTQGAPYEFSVRVTDEDEGIVSEDSVIVTVDDANPTLVDTLVTLPEGQPLGSLIRFRDGADQWTVNAVFSDGESEAATVIADPSKPLGSTWIAQLSHAFANEGRYTIDLTIDDLVDGTTSSYTVDVTVENAAPTYVSAIVGPASAGEASDAIFSIEATDVPADTVTYEWDFDYDEATFNSSATGARVSYRFPDQGTYLVAVRATDGLNAAGVLTHPVTVSNSDPVVDLGAVQGLWDEGDTLSFDGAAVVTDAIGDTVSYLWELLDAGNGVVGSSSNSLFTYATSDQATYTLRLTVGDEDGGGSQETWPINVVNVAPEFEIAVSIEPRVEGQKLTFSASGLYEPGGDTLTYAWSAVGPYGDDLTMVGATTASAQFTPVDEGVYWITLAVDDETDSATRTVKLAVTNEDPTLSGVGGGSSTPSGAPLEVTGSVSDAGTTDELTGIVDFGDGVTLPLELDSGNFELDYQYRQSGQYHVTVTARDLDGGESQQTFIHNVDVNAPTVTLDPLTTVDDRPELSGTIDDAAATVTVVIATQSYQAINNGDGTWTLLDDTIPDAAPLGLGENLIRVVATDAAGNETLISGDITLLALAPHPGDADLSGATDLSDFNIWNANKFTSGTEWRTGDFNGDGLTDLSDFNIWNAHKFTSIPDPAPFDIALKETSEHRLDALLDELAWLSEAYQATASRRPSGNNSTVEAAVDRLLATYWE